jgi:hypothetical protein
MFGFILVHMACDSTMDLVVGLIIGVTDAIMFDVHGISNYGKCDRQMEVFLFSLFTCRVHLWRVDLSVASQVAGLSFFCKLDATVVDLSMWMCSFTGDKGSLSYCWPLPEHWRCMIVCSVGSRYIYFFRCLLHDGCSMLLSMFWVGFSATDFFGVCNHDRCGSRICINHTVRNLRFPRSAFGYLRWDMLGFMFKGRLLRLTTWSNALRRKVIALLLYPLHCS